MQLYPACNCYLLMKSEQRKLISIHRVSKLWPPMLTLKFSQVMRQEIHWPIEAMLFFHIGLTPNHFHVSPWIRMEFYQKPKMGVTRINQEFASPLAFLFKALILDSSTLPKLLPSSIKAMVYYKRWRSQKHRATNFTECKQNKCAKCKLNLFLLKAWHMHKFHKQVVARECLNLSLFKFFNNKY